MQTFGVNNWNYVLLSQISICVAFTAIWLLARQFFRPAQALAAVCLLEFVPYYSFLGIRLNHTSLLISLWAVGTLFAYLAVQRRRLIYWVLLGLSMALALRKGAATDTTSTLLCNKIEGGAPPAPLPRISDFC